MNVRTKGAPITGTSILTYEPTGAAADACHALAEEVEHARSARAGAGQLLPAIVGDREAYRWYHGVRIGAGT